MNEWKNIVKELTLDEKIGMIHGDGLFRTKGVERLSIPPLIMSDGPMGVRNDFKNDEWKAIGQNDDYVTYLPSISALASTWNRELAYTSGEVLGEEARGRGKDVILGPGVNIKRTPLCGRNFEYFSEDPYLTIEMAVPFIKGVQKHDVAACLKHFALNNQETNRMNLNVVVDEKTLHSIYLRVFQEIIEQAKPYSVMGSYSKLYDEFCCESDYLTNQLLRSKWQYDGVLITDWGAVHNTKEAAEAGVDIEMSVTSNFDDYCMANPLKKAIQSGEIEEVEIDKKVERILLLMKRIKVGDPTRKPGAYNTPAHREKVLEVARESIILLKNEEKILPLSKNIKSILVIGENAVRQHANGGGSAEINALYEITPLMGIKMLLGGNVKVDYIPGYESKGQIDDSNSHPDASDLNWQADSLNNKRETNNNAMTESDRERAKELREEALAKAKNYDTIIYIGGLNHDFDVENQDRGSMKLPYEQEELIGALLRVKPETVVVLCGGSPVELEAIGENAKALLFMYYAGMEGGRALAEILFGEVNPSGHIAETFPMKYTDTPIAEFGEFPGGESVSYQEGPFVGYRYYDTFQQTVAFPFGHGLSYTEFEYTDFELDRENLTLSGSVTNSGTKEGKALLQVYCGPAQYGNMVERIPKKELIQFEKITLLPKETKAVSIQLEPRLIHASKELQLYVGTSVNDIIFSQNMIPGSKDHAFHACMKKHEFGTRKT